jgi:cation:H+ antiporter
LAIPALIHPSNVPVEIMKRDYWVMLLLTMLLGLFLFNFKGRNIVNRIEGFLLVGVFGSYMWILFWFQN